MAANTGYAGGYGASAILSSVWGGRRYDRLRSGGEPGTGPATTVMGRPGAPAQRAMARARAQAATAPVAPGRPGSDGLRHRRPARHRRQGLRYRCRRQLGATGYGTGRHQHRLDGPTAPAQARPGTAPAPAPAPATARLPTGTGSTGYGAGTGTGEPATARAPLAPARPATVRHRSATDSTGYGTGTGTGAATAGARHGPAVLRHAVDSRLRQTGGYGTGGTSTRPTGYGTGAAPGDRLRNGHWHRRNRLRNGRHWHWPTARAALRDGSTARLARPRTTTGTGSTRLRHRRGSGSAGTSSADGTNANHYGTPSPTASAYGTSGGYGSGAREPRLDSARWRLLVAWRNYDDAAGKSVAVRDLFAAAGQHTVGHPAAGASLRLLRSAAGQYAVSIHFRHRCGELGHAVAAKRLSGANSNDPPAYRPGSTSSYAAAQRGQLAGRIARFIDAGLGRYYGQLRRADQRPGQLKTAVGRKSRFRFRNAGYASA